MVSSAVIVTFSDAVSQLGQGDMKDYNFRRTLVVGIGYGGLWFGPLLHGITTTWARILPSTSAPAIVFKTVIDMTTSFPLNLSAMISLQGKNMISLQLPKAPIFCSHHFSHHFHSNCQKRRSDCCFKKKFGAFGSCWMGVLAAYELCNVQGDFL
jgi:hypothetical protein